MRIENMKETLQKTKVMVAYTEGKKIECKRKSGDAHWHIVDFPAWDFSSYEYRISEKPKYRPFTFKEACDHIGEKITNSNCESVSVLLITSVSQYKDGEVRIEGMDAQTLLDNYVFLKDGKPCGVEEV